MAVSRYNRRLIMWFLGVYYPETVKYFHWKELPTGMSAVKPEKKEESNDA